MTPLETELSRSLYVRRNAVCDVPEIAEHYDCIQVGDGAFLRDFDKEAVFEAKIILRSSGLGCNFIFSFGVGYQAGRENFDLLNDPPTAAVWSGPNTRSDVHADADEISVLKAGELRHRVQDRVAILERASSFYYRKDPSADVGIFASASTLDLSFEIIFVNPGWEVNALGDGSVLLFKRGMDALIERVLEVCGHFPKDAGELQGEDAFNAKPMGDYAPILVWCGEGGVFAGVRKSLCVDLELVDFVLSQ